MGAQASDIGAADRAGSTTPPQGKPNVLVIIADDPFELLDQDQSQRAATTLLKLQRSRTTVILLTDHPQLAQTFLPAAPSSGIAIFLYPHHAARASPAPTSMPAAESRGQCTPT
mgnify:CR=1 FL=1